MALFQGVGTAIVTPFNEKGEVCYNTFEKLIEFQIVNDVDAIIACGTTGESATLSYEERADVIKFTVETVAGRVPVIGGGGSNSTASTIRLCQDAQNAGADGILAVTPYYNKTTQKGLVEHYTAVAKEVDLPIIVYNVPVRTGLNIEPETLLKLSKVDNIVGIKESAGNLVQTAKMAALCGADFDIYAGNCNEVLASLSLGAVGCISVMGNVAPKDLHDLCVSFRNGDLAMAQELQFKALPLIDALFAELNPIPVKYILNLMGFNVGICRPPLTTLEDEHVGLITKAAKNYGLI
ncbi:MAG: 4-hydroxy-tetrahydrodipicolinate synthase [Defluviitaleaceae bacterium]|nr:4-hydroxy-tetrahydrodipicolinate synthase [Defluviitaleaceae bacterium]